MPLGISSVLFCFSVNYNVGYHFSRLYYLLFTDMMPVRGRGQQFLRETGKGELLALT